MCRASRVVPKGRPRVCLFFFPGLAGLAVADASPSTWTVERASRSPSREAIVTARAKAYRAREGPGLRRANACESAPSADATADQRSAILALVDELATLAADLWFAKKLENFPVHEESRDVDDD